jgi:hypothetical protein
VFYPDIVVIIRIVTPSVWFLFGKYAFTDPVVSFVLLIIMAEKFMHISFAGKFIEISVCLTEPNTVTGAVMEKYNFLHRILV